ncbi:MAG: Restriction modification system DNA specificity domain-containing protein [Candidatus Azambacteria bacterium GW2011_GWE1_42_9]|nr:MAG: Restriction modification system DNA specificity domain-containing protein [Candidatus Azambacteria bacterium GW2011_GWF1_41_10]KKS49210.1 MAG: Restriction modification system DNA specificity domain-containing protein [Candidatus Azambacteria bacterium GW2011_GWF2_42_22]KKS74576.1 MAG: Restriction modification system DNA specificity domain-containing protein [Candidatus Azambacteria bacterium GW2011_GWB1_42_72]KKS79475.1 MAG: Restriction modification system DNA specificity domain-containi
MPSKAVQLETKKIPKLRFPGFSGVWEENKLGEVSKFWNGKAHEQDISEYGKYIVVNSKFISQNGEVKKYSDKQISSLKKDDIAIVMSDIPNGKAISKCFLVNEDNTYTLNQRIGGIKSKEIVSPFLIRILNRNKYFLKFDNGVSQTNLRKDEVLRCPVIFPSIPEQQKISDFLRSTDAWIENLQAQKESFESYKKGMMQKIFAQEIRFKDEDGKEFPKWEEKKLGEICDKAKSGGTPTSTKKEYYDGSIPFLSIADMTKSGKYILQTEKSISEEGLKNSSAWIVPKGSLIYSMYASVGFVAINQIPLATSQAMINLIPNSKIINLEYLYYYLFFYKKLVHSFIETGTQGNLNAKIVKNFFVPVPLFLEQQKIAGFLTSIDKIIESKQQQIVQAEQWKRGLMQGLFV